jgi:hypothetical protein
MFDGIDHAVCLGAGEKDIGPQAVLEIEYLNPGFEETAGGEVTLRLAKVEGG